MLYRQTARHVSIARAAILCPFECWLSKAAFALGIYLALFYDFIPDRIPVVGLMDQGGLVVVGMILARCLVTPEFLEERGVAPRLRSSPVAGPPRPNFFIVGAAKAGTTSLFQALTRHPDIFGCPVKEPNYFAFDLTGRDAGQDRQPPTAHVRDPDVSVLAPPRVATTKNLADYTALYAGWSGQTAIGEASTTYLPSRVAAREIARFAPDARIIIVLRHPVERSYSSYLMQLQLGNRLGTFREVAEQELARIAAGDGEPWGIVAGSFYAPQVRRYQRHFRREQILFLLFDELIARPRQHLHAVFRHLGVDPHAAAGITLGWENRTRMPRFRRLGELLLRNGAVWMLLRAIPRPVRRRLRGLYYLPPPATPAPPDGFDTLLEAFRDDMAETAVLIGRDLTHWMKRSQL
jgi:hypothetical protein